MNTEPFRKYLRQHLPRTWRLATHLAWRARLSNRWTETTLFRQLRAIHRKRKTAGTSGSHVLFFASRQERDQVALVSTLASALGLRGHRTTVIGCDHALRQSCNSGFYPEINAWTCRTCHLYARHAREVDGLPTEWLQSLRTNDEVLNAQQVVDALHPDQYQELIYRNFPIGRMVRHSVAHFLRTDKIMEDASSVRTYRDWLVSGIWLVDACERILQRHTPEVVVLLNGLFAPEWIMLEAARRRGIRVVTWEVAFRPETFFFRHSRAIDMCDNDNWPLFRDRPLTADENARLDDYLRLRETGGGYLVNYFPRLEASLEAVCREWKIDRSKRIVVLFANITWDSSLFEKDIGFRDMADWIFATIRHFEKRPDVQLVIRAHPAEVIFPGADRDSVVEMINREFPVLPGNVVIIPPSSGASSYVLMEMASCGLVYGSTTGMEMGIRGVPVICTGQIYYRGLGLTFDARSREEYGSMIDAVLDGSIDYDKEATIELWRRYAYFAMFRAAIGLRQIHYQKDGDQPTITYHSLEELDSGRDANLDTVCEGIVKGTRFLASEI